ncbi:hypothetical protein Aduo_003906 [Ancylostoma duodenale]
MPNYKDVRLYTRVHNYVGPPQLTTAYFAEADIIRNDHEKQPFSLDIACHSREHPLVWWLTLIVIIIFVLSGVSFLSSACDFIGLRYRRVRAKSHLVRFDEIMRRVGNGTITGTPLAPNEQVLRAVCKCNVVAASYRDFYRVSSMSPIAFECDAPTESYNRMPATPII